MLSTIASFSLVLGFMIRQKNRLHLSCWEMLHCPPFCLLAQLSLQGTARYVDWSRWSPADWSRWSPADWSRWSPADWSRWSPIGAQWQLTQLWTLGPTFDGREYKGSAFFFSLFSGQNSISSFQAYTSSARVPLQHYRIGSCSCRAVNWGSYQAGNIAPRCNTNTFYYLTLEPPKSLRGVRLPWVVVGGLLEKVPLLRCPPSVEQGQQTPYNFCTRGPAVLECPQIFDASCSFCDRPK